MVEHHLHGHIGCSGLVRDRWPGLGDVSHLPLQIVVRRHRQFFDDVMIEARDQIWPKRPLIGADVRCREKLAKAKSVEVIPLTVERCCKDLHRKGRHIRRFKHAAGVVENNTNRLGLGDAAQR